MRKKKKQFQKYYVKLSTKFPFLLTK